MKAKGLASRIAWILVGLALAMPLGGCSNSPSAVSIPEWDPPGFASAILAELDKNGDTLVDKAELTAAPGLAFGARFIDTSGDGKLSRDELETRFSKYRERRLGLTSQPLRLTRNGRPLVDARVQLVPEFFLSETIEPAEGTTLVEGMVYPSVSGQQTALMRVGYYRVQVTSPTVNLPAKFNTASTVGVEVSPFPNEPATAGPIEIQLRDK
jgi:hypothetical protein